MSDLQGLDVNYTGWRGSLGGIPVNSVAWGEKNWADMARTGAKKRRDNVVLDGANGVRGYPADIGPAGPIDLFWVVIGSHDRYGTPYDDFEAGLEANLQVLFDGWFAAEEDERGTIPATIIGPSGKLYVARVQVDEFVPTGGWDDCELRVSVTLPEGPAMLLPEEESA